MNSHRDSVKDAIFNVLDAINIPEAKADELKYDIADGVFDALGITEDEQDAVGGYFMLHAEKSERQFVPPKPTELKPMPEFSGEFGSTKNLVNEYTRRTKELDDGAKYNRLEFKSYAVGREVLVDLKRNGDVLEETKEWYITLQTPICKYGQGYSGVSLEEAKESFAKFYYPMYCEDYERSKEVDKMDIE